MDVRKFRKFRKYYDTLTVNVNQTFTVRTVTTVTVNGNIKLKKWSKRTQK